MQCLLENKLLTHIPLKVTQKKIQPRILSYNIVDHHQIFCCVIFSILFVDGEFKLFPKSMMTLLQTHE